MLIRMRTTLVIDDALLRQAKQHAARVGLSLSGLVERALRDTLREPQTAAGPFRMPTFGAPGRGLRHEPQDFAELLMEDEAESLRSR
jgi:hypothetical protein